MRPAAAGLCRDPQNQRKFNFGDALQSDSPGVLPVLTILGVLRLGNEYVTARSFVLILETDEEYSPPAHNIKLQPDISVMNLDAK
jgi:hypothetical protein